MRVAPNVLYGAILHLHFNGAPDAAGSADAIDFLTGRIGHLFSLSHQ